MVLNRSSVPPSSAHCHPERNMHGTGCFWSSWPAGQEYAGRSSHNRLAASL